VADLDQEIDRLFELSPEEFTAARNELSRRLKSEGDSSAAQEVKQLGKPTVAAWTVNQLARREHDAIRDLLAAGTTLREAQERALQDSAGAGDALRQAQEGERRALRALIQRAQRILESAGRPASRSVLDQISSTLRAAAVSEVGQAALEAGRLSGEVKSSGFDALAGIEVAERSRAPRRRAAPARDELAERRREKKERELRRRELRERARKLEQEATEAEREAERADRAAAAARAAAEQSRCRAEDAARELDELDS
jgi:hypothetical protein